MNRQPNQTETESPVILPSNEQEPAIDPVHFDRRKRTEAIRLNEEAEREKRRKLQAARRRAEYRRRARIARLKAMCLFAVMVLGVLCIAIAGIVAAVKALNKPKAPALPDGAVTPEETALVEAFNADTAVIYVPGNTLAATANAFLNDTSLGIPQSTAKVGEFGELARRYAGFGTSDGYFALKNALRDVPMYANGYLWTETTGIRSSETDGYFYDTDTAFVSAVANICLWEGDGLYLSEADTDNQPKLDKSQGLTVLEKLNEVTAYLFRADTERGVKYDPLSGLVYIHTPDNDGTSSGNGSNRWFNFRFGYLDAYENISFGRAVTDLAKLYTLLGETEKADEYTRIAEKNRAAFNEKFWDEKKGRYIGCIDINGAVHDYGFVFLNLEAIEAGFADAEKAEKIFAWLDGNRTVEGDTAIGTDIYFGAFIRNTTLAAKDSWWDYLGGTLPLSENGGWGRYYQNGGYSLSTTYYDIMARYKTGRTQEAAEHLKQLLNAYADGTLTTSDGTVRISGDALAGLAQTAYIRTVFGLDTDGFRLCMTPDYAFLAALESSDETDAEAEKAAKSEKKAKKDEEAETAHPTIGLHNITFSRNGYGVLLDADTVYITAQNKQPVRLRLGGFEAGVSYDLVMVEGGFEKVRTPYTSDESGYLDISADFGGTSYLKIEKTPLPEAKKK